MTLSSGTRLGQFEIKELVGVGEVYRATDMKLGRDVAIKVLSGTFTLDGKRLARFMREAQLLASLDHPNICAVHDLQESDGTHFMVMPLIEGDTLADRIARGAIPVEEALPIFAQIAEALEAAHEQGIIHRDLKPGNIKVSADGRVKVLDFGLGKAIEYPERLHPSTPRHR
jgi:eukaryotic-like serine/threonine-protein kinase